MTAVLESIDTAWLERLSELEQGAILSSLIECLYGFDSVGLDETFERAEAMLDSLDRAMNGAHPEGFAALVPSEARPVLWACFWASLRDVHAPLDNLTDPQWELAEVYYGELDF